MGTAASPLEWRSSDEFINDTKDVENTILGSSYEIGDIADLLIQVGLTKLGHRLQATAERLHSAHKTLGTALSRKSSDDFRRAEESSFNLLNAVVAVQTGKELPKRAGTQ